MTLSTITWPPAFTVKRHVRAKHVKLKASARNGLELVLPTRFSLKHLPEILESHKAWIIKQLTALQAATAAINNVELPKQITFAAVNLIWNIQYIKTPNPNKIKMITRPQQELVVMGDTDNLALCKKALTTWAKAQAKIHLTGLLKKVSAYTQLNYSSVMIRNQQTRWGSCSSDKAISLNYKLIFLPEPLANHILIHELCHTIHLNHSGKFWRLVASFDPQWKQHSHAIKRGDSFIPGWAC